MGTHPIFESDFDCLTEDTKTMSGTLDETKVLKDFTAEVDEKVPAAHKLAQNDYAEAVEFLMPLEKNCRVNYENGAKMRRIRRGNVENGRFARALRRTYGVPPRQYRRQNLCRERARPAHAASGAVEGDSRRKGRGNGHYH